MATKRPFRFWVPERRPRHFAIFIVPNLAGRNDEYGGILLLAADRGIVQKHGHRRPRRSSFNFIDSRVGGRNGRRCSP
jgi:hypothetical protein